MKLEADITRIEELARRKTDENWRFRRFLKESDLTVEAIDAIVHRLYKSVSQQIDCLTCANCCKMISPSLDSKDTKRLARSLDLTEDEFRSEYLKRNEEDGEYYFKDTPCRFLEGNNCTVYRSRPDLCRSYPHLDKPKFVFRTMQAVFNCSVCPIVYNLFEQLKDELCFK